MAIAVFAVLLVTLVAACGLSDDTDEATPSVASTATSVADFGDMDALIAAAKEEGTLNVIALPPDWANYKEMLFDLRVQVRDHDQLGAARRQQPGRDQCGDPIEGHGSRPGRL